MKMPASEKPRQQGESRPELEDSGFLVPTHTPEMQEGVDFSQLVFKER